MKKIIILALIFMSLRIVAQTIYSPSTNGIPGFTPVTVVSSSMNFTGHTTMAGLCLTNPSPQGITLVSNVMSGVTCASNVGNCDACQLFVLNIGSTSTANAEVAHVYFANTSLPAPIAIIPTMATDQTNSAIIGPTRAFWVSNLSTNGYSIMNGASPATANSIFAFGLVPVRP